jgi:transcriptional regulator
MYIPKHFKITDTDEIFSFIQTNEFGQLVSSLNGRLYATHIPFLLSDDKTKLYGHLARQNPQLESLENQEVMITLLGPHDYISPSWYVDKGVPTWNYQAVHLYGQCTLLNEPEEVKTIVDTLAQKNEKDFPEPWQPSYKAAMLSAIVGVEFSISDIECKYKLSQNRSEPDQTGVIEHLNARGSNALANAILKNGFKAGADKT